MTANSGVKTTAWPDEDELPLILGYNGESVDQPWFSILAIPTVVLAIVGGVWFIGSFIFAIISSF